MRLDELRDVPMLESNDYYTQKDALGTRIKFYNIKSIGLISTGIERTLKPCFILGIKKSELGFELIYSEESREKYLDKKFIKTSMYGAYDPRKKLAAINPKSIDIKKIIDYVPIQDIKY